MFHPTTTNKIHHCLAEIEQKLGWGTASAWQNRDFEQLSDLILEKTGVRLSHTTLKRVWGKVSYTASPAPATLDALAQFAGYLHWRDFAGPNDASVAQNGVYPVLQNRAKPFFLHFGRLKWLAGLTGLLLLASLFMFSLEKPQPPLVFGQVSFSSDPVAFGLPNTVIFRYDAADTNADSVFIQQSWDERLRFRVDKSGKSFASTYYYPGYFRAKLVLNDSIVREHDLYIRSGGWLGTVRRDSIPLYFRGKAIQQAEGLAITARQLAKAGLDTLLTAPQTGLHFVENLGELSAMNFTFETDLKSDFDKGDAVCQRVNVLIRCSNGIFIFPLSIPGCVGELTLFLNEQIYNGQTTDLSGFGVSFADWASLKVEVKDGAVKAAVNGRTAFSGRLARDPGKVVGITYRFKGPFSVRSARFDLPGDPTCLDLLSPM